MDTAIFVKFFLSKATYEMYRDFQEFTINSDGAFGMWFVIIGSLYLIHEMYNYFLPWYWNKTATISNGEENLNRMRDAIASTLVEVTYGISIGEWGWMPHDFHSIRRRLSSGLSHPDDVRAMHFSGVNRKHRYVEHYRKKVGMDETSMILR